MRSHLSRPLRRGCQVRKTALPIVVFSLVAIVGAELAAAPPDDDPVEIKFNTTFVEPNVWQGLVGGSFAGAVRAVMQRSAKNGAIWDMNCTWIVDAGRFSSIARLSGIYSTETGKVVMNGVVTDGFRKGERAHLRASLVSIPQRFRFIGTFRIGGEEEREDDRERGDSHGPDR